MLPLRFLDPCKVRAAGFAPIPLDHLRSEFRARPDGPRRHRRHRRSDRRTNQDRRGQLGVLGLDAAVSLFLEAGPQHVEEHVIGITDELCERLLRAGSEIVSSRAASEKSGIVIFRTPGVNPDALHARLTAAGIRCAPRGGGIRFSPHFYNNTHDIDAAFAAMRPRSAWPPFGWR